jgi:hypothetical protein
MRKSNAGGFANMTEAAFVVTSRRLKERSWRLSGARECMIAALPAATAAISVAENPYYYANGVYYAPQGRQYTVVPPPQGAVVAIPPPSCSTVYVGSATELDCGGRVLRTCRERRQSQPAADWLDGHDIAERRSRSKARPILSSPVRITIRSTAAAA